jgi:hypothetical protein
MERRQHLKILCVCVLAYGLLPAGCEKLQVQSPTAIASRPATVPAAPGFRIGSLKGEAAQIVFVIDKSGSMVDGFEDLRGAVDGCISGLKSTQRFHLVLFSTGMPLEGPAQGLVYATDGWKYDADRFLVGVRSDGQSTALHGLTRAFNALDAGDAKQSKAIVLVTDDLFPDGTMVTDLIRRRNADKSVRIYVWLVGTPRPVAVDFFKRLAAENGGKYSQPTVDD